MDRMKLSIIIAMAALVAAPLVLATPVPVDTLRGGSFEGPEGYAQSGWQRDFGGASQVDTTHARTGLQSINLGPEYPWHTSGEMGKVTAIPSSLVYVGPETAPGSPEVATSAIKFSNVSHVAVWSLTTSVYGSTGLQIVLQLRTQPFTQAFPPVFVASSSYCVYQTTPWTLESSDEWAPHNATKTDTFQLADDRCQHDIGEPQTLADLRNDPLVTDASVFSVTIQSLPPNGPYPAGHPIYVDDLGLFIDGPDLPAMG
ncbi:MAG: hypothetical protein WDA16_11840 [Candidatus Thermoplasmatota archaeon]